MPVADRIGLTGWGRESDAPAKSLYFEQIGREANLRKYGNDRFGEPVRPPMQLVQESPIEREIRKLFRFDEGWDFEEVEKLIYGQPLVRGPQNIGNCVGYSHCLGLAERIAYEILVKGDPEEVLGDYRISGTPVPFIPYSYGAGRCLAGNMCGGGDGSYCEVQIEASQEHGFLPSDTPGLPGPFPQSSAQVGRQWGSSKSTLQTWRPKAITFDLEHSWQCKSADDVWKAIVVDKQPVQICSGWGFVPKEQITLNGVRFWLYVKGGGWSHSMTLMGAWKIGGRRFFKDSNQWGMQAHKDGYYFVVEDDTMDKWVRNAHAATIGEIKGRPTQRVQFPM